MKRYKQNIAIWTCILIPVILIISSKIWLPGIALFLLPRDRIGRVDCIVPLGGDLYYRYKKTVELYKQGYAPNIVISLLPEKNLSKNNYCDMAIEIYGLKQKSRKDFALMALKYFGKDKENVYFTPERVTSTYEEALATKEFMLKHKFKSLIFVTSGYHTRRALMLFNAVFKGTGIKIYNCTAVNDSFNPRKWWESELDVKKVMQEYLSIIHNAIYHIILKKKRTDFDSY